MTDDPWALSPGRAGRFGNGLASEPGRPAVTKDGALVAGDVPPTWTRNATGNRGVAAGLRLESQRSSYNAIDFWAFVLPAVSFAEVTIVGRVFVSELAMLVMLPWLWAERDRIPMPRWVVVLWAGWLLGQIVTDLVVASAFEDLARGWAAIVFTITNFAAILVVAGTPRRARLFALGLATGGVVGYLLMPDIYASADPWKWAFALPLLLVLAPGLSGRRGSSMPWLGVAAFAVLGVVNLVLGARSLGGISLVTAGYLALQAMAARRTASGHPVLLGAIGVALLSVLGLGALQLYDAAAAGGFLGASAQAKHEVQSGEFGNLIGGRPEILVSVQAVLDAPIIGHGSWARDLKYADLLTDRLSSLGYEVGASPFDLGLIPTHSHVMQAWVWAGVLGGLFWLAILVAPLWLLARLYTRRLELSPLLVFSAVLLVWTIVFDPYGQRARLREPFEIAVCLLGFRLLVSSAQDAIPPRARDGIAALQQAASGGFLGRAGQGNRGAI